MIEKRDLQNVTHVGHYYTINRYRQYNSFVCCLYQTWGPDTRSQGRTHPPFYHIIGAMTSSSNRRSMGMYRSFKILIITSIAVYILSNKGTVSVKDAHTKILSPIGDSTKISNIDMSETVRLHNIKWTLRLKYESG